MDNLCQWYVKSKNTCLQGTLTMDNLCQWYVKSKNTCLQGTLTMDNLCQRYVKSKDTCLQGTLTMDNLCQWYVKSKNTSLQGTLTMDNLCQWMSRVKTPVCRALLRWTKTICVTDVQEWRHLQDCAVMSSAHELFYSYSRTSMARTPMPRLPWMSRTRSWVRRDFLQIRYTDNLGRFSSLIL